MVEFGDEFRAQASQLPEPLTAREQELLQLLADGLSNAEIGERLCLTMNTVKWYLKNIYGKLGVHKRTAAVGRGRVLGLLRRETFNIDSLNPPIARSRRMIPASRAELTLPKR